MRLTEFFESQKMMNSSGAVVLLVIAVLSVYMVYDESSMWILVSVLFAAVLSTFFLFISGWADEPRLRKEVLMWLQAALTVWLYFLVDVSFIAILGIVWIVQAVEIWGIRKASLFLVFSVSIFTISQLYHWYDSDFLSAIVSSVALGIFQVFALSATQRAVRERELREKTAVLNRELVATRDLLSQSAKQSERLRIARDLHDLVGHHMTALILNLEVANHCSEGKARDKVEQSLSLAKLLLSDIRNAVNELRVDDAFNLKQSIEKLVAEIPGLKVELGLPTTTEINNLELAETMLRCIQEAITNVLRHSTASHCQISICAKDGKFLLSVKDNGRTEKTLIPGNGLKGMRERVIKAGGEISWDKGLDGFSLQISLPAGASR